MKKWICLLICLALILSLTIGGTCSDASRRTGQYPAPGVNDVIKQGMAEADRKKADNSGTPAENETQNRHNTEGQKMKTSEPSSKPDASPIPEERADEVDVDLTVLSSTMVYSEVYDMMISPEKYIGKTVKMRGLYFFFHDEVTGNNYSTCVIQDATACCARGIEFVLTDDYVFPDDYPEIKEEICVVGVFHTYQEGNHTYCTLKNAKLV